MYDTLTVHFRQNGMVHIRTCIREYTEPLRVCRAGRTKLENQDTSVKNGGNTPVRFGQV